MSPSRFVLIALASAPVAWAQLSPADIVFAGLSARTRQLDYQSHGGDMTAVARLLASANYRGITHASVVMSGLPWTPDAELTTGLDFAISAKLAGTGENLAARATFLFDAPAAGNGPYRMRLDLVKADGSTEASIEPGIMLGDVRGRRSGEIIGLTFDPSKIVQPGLHTILSNA